MELSNDPVKAAIDCFVDSLIWIHRVPDPAFRLDDRNTLRVAETCTILFRLYLEAALTPQNPA